MGQSDCLILCKCTVIITLLNHVTKWVSAHGLHGLFLFFFWGGGVYLGHNPGGSTASQHSPDQRPLPCNLLGWHCAAPKFTMAKRNMAFGLHDGGSSLALSVKHVG